MFCGIIGFIFIYWLLRYIIGPVTLMFIKFYVFTLLKKHVKVIKNSGKWAVVTGSTDGIGREYCRQLARLGLNIFLVSRDESKLELTSKELKRYYKIDVKFFKADFTSNSIYERLDIELKDLDIGVLVNNVGMSLKYPDNFHNLDTGFSFFSDVINCNILSAISMMKIVLPGMIKRKRGIIINISSISSVIQLVMNALYSSTKSFLTQFSMITGMELSNCGITVQTVLPSYVQTKFIGKYVAPRFLAYSPEEFVESAIQMVGIESFTYGTVRHSLQGILFYSLPSFLKVILTTTIQKMRYKGSRKDQ